MSNDVSRRDFLRKAGVGALGLGVLTLTGCSPAADPTPTPENTTPATPETVGAPPWPWE